MPANASPHRRRSALTAALLCAAVLAPAAPAAADSIVYLDGGNVWSARPDGGGRVQLTDGGDWHSPTQADDGTIAAVRGTGPIEVLARDGRPLRTIATPAARSSDGGTFDPRPVELALSPDGSRLAYAYVASSCPVGTTCGTIQKSTFYTAADVTEATPHSVWGNQFGTHNPSWVTNERTLLFGGYGRQVTIDDLGPGDYSQLAWVTPEADMGDGEVSRDGSRLVTTFGYGADTRLTLFSVNGDVRTQAPPPQPTLRCELGPDQALGGPSWSPDGSAIAFETSAGIELLRFSDFDGCVTTGDSVVFAAGGSTPDWGPADPPPARWTPPVEQRRDGEQQRPGDDGRRPVRRAPSRPAPKAVLTAPATTTVAALRRGLTVRLSTVSGARVTVVLHAGKGVLARRSVVTRGTKPLAIRLAKPPARALRGVRRGSALRLTATVRAGGRSRTVARTIRVR